MTAQQKNVTHVTLCDVCDMSHTSHFRWICCDVQPNTLLNYYHMALYLQTAMTKMCKQLPYFKNGATKEVQHSEETNINQ